jgi:hypothetical protein
LLPLPFLSTIASRRQPVPTSALLRHASVSTWRVWDGPCWGPQFIISVGLFYDLRATVPVCAYAAVLDPASAAGCPPVWRTGSSSYIVPASIVVATKRDAAYPIGPGTALWSPAPWRLAPLV